MRFLQESLIYRLLLWLFHCYQGSVTKKLLSGLAEACRHSLPGRWVKNTMARESAFHNSQVFRALRAVFRVLDRWFMKLSAAVKRWSETSLIINAFRLVAEASKERLFALAFPVFGIGYLGGRILRGDLMIRDVLLLGLLFVVSGILLIDRETRKAIWKNSLVYRMYQLILE